MVSALWTLVLALYLAGWVADLAHDSTAALALAGAATFALLVALLVDFPGDSGRLR